MSFKRDGDDKNAVDNLRRRRVADLLYEDIQEGEVSKLRNGRYIYMSGLFWGHIHKAPKENLKLKYLCKLCQHSPTFDTLNMFQVHKQGKKHQNSLVYHEGKNQELQDLIQKRHHELATGHIDVGEAKVLEPGFFQPCSKPLPYDSRSKRHKAKPYDRKPTLDLQCFAKTTSTNDTATTPLESLPGYSLTDTGGKTSHRQKECEAVKQFPQQKMNQSDNGSQKLGGQRSSVNQCKSFNTTSSNQFKLRNFKTNHVNGDDEIVKTNDVSKLLGLENSDNSKHYFARRQKIQTTNNSVEPVGRFLPKQEFTKSWEYFKGRPIPKVVVPVKKVTETRTESLSGCHNKQDSKAGAQQMTMSVDKGTSGTEIKERAEKMLTALGSGWKKDWTGNWVKDEDAEFDSDEEPPNLT